MKTGIFEYKVALSSFIYSLREQFLIAVFSVVLVVVGILSRVVQ